MSTKHTALLALFALACEQVYDAGHSLDGSAPLDAPGVDGGPSCAPCPHCTGGDLFESIAVAGAQSASISLAVDASGAVHVVYVSDDDTRLQRSARARLSRSTSSRARRGTSSSSRRSRGSIAKSARPRC